MCMKIINCTNSTQIDSINIIKKYAMLTPCYSNIFKGFYIHVISTLICWGFTSFACSAFAIHVQLQNSIIVKIKFCAKIKNRLCIVIE